VVKLIVTAKPGVSPLVLGAPIPVMPDAGKGSAPQERAGARAGKVALGLPSPRPRAAAYAWKTFPGRCRLRAPTFSHPRDWKTPVLWSPHPLGRRPVGPAQESAPVDVLVPGGTGFVRAPAGGPNYLIGHRLARNAWRSVRLQR
jgi:hypothetical protein